MLVLYNIVWVFALDLLLIVDNWLPSLKNNEHFWYELPNVLFYSLTTKLQGCFYSSPEPEAQESFSDQNLSLYRRYSCHHRCRCKLFTFSSSPEPLGQIQPNLVQIILRQRGFKFVQMKDLTSIKGKIEIGWFHLKIFSRTTGPEKLKFIWKLPNVVEIQVRSNHDPKAAVEPH